MSFYNAPGFQNQFVTPPISDPLLGPSWNTSIPYSYSDITSSNPSNYMGPTPYQSAGQQGFWSGLNQLSSPFSSEYRWGNPIYNNRDAIDSVSTRPFDATVWAGQRLVAPALAFGAAFKLLGPKSFGGYFTGSGFGASFGKSAAQGLTRGILGGIGLPRFAVAAGEAGAGVVGSLAGGLAIPALAAYGTLKAGQALVWDPYINTRKMGQDLMNNFEGITFGDSQGNSVTGGGLSYRESYRMGANLTRAGMRDLTFSAAEYSQISDLSARSGLLDTANSRQLTDRIKGIAEQIKLVMAISKDPNFKDAIEQIAQLQFSGASAIGGRFSQAANAFMDIGRSATIAGTTVQRMMGTVGAQGQALYQAYGMTPYLGQLAAANIYSSFATGQREGLISSSHIARLGGLDNATESALSGQLQGGRSTLMQMALYNQYFGGGTGPTVPGKSMNMISTIGQFTNSFTKDPMGVMGRLSMFGDQMIALDIQKNGGLGLESAIMSYGKNLPLKRDPDGKISAEQLVPIMQSMGMTRDQIDSFLSMRASQTDPMVVAAQMRGSGRFTDEQLRQYISQNKLYGGVAGSLYRGVVQGAKNLASNVGGAVGDAAASVIGGTGDNFQSIYDSFAFGGSLSQGGSLKNASSMFKRTSEQSFDNVRFLSEDMKQWNNIVNPQSFKTIVKNLKGVFSSTDVGLSQSLGIAKKINQLAKQGNATALSFLSSSDTNTKASLLQRLLADNKEYFGDEGRRLNNPNDSTGFSQFLDASSKLQTGSFTPKQSTSIGEQYSSELDSVTGVKTGSFYNLLAIGQATNFMASSAAGDSGAGNVLDFLKDPKNAALARAVGPYSNRDDAFNKVRALFQKGSEHGLGTMGVEATKVDLDAISKDPSLIANPEIRQHFVDAQKAGNARGVEQALTENLVDSLGGMTHGRRLKNAGKIDVESTIGELSIDIQDADKRKQLQSYLKQGLIDYSGFQNSMNSMDMKQSTKIFGEAVDKFSTTVDKMSQGSGAPQQKGMTILGIPIFGNPNNQRDTTSGNQ